MYAFPRWSVGTRGLVSTAESRHHRYVPVGAKHFLPSSSYIYHPPKMLRPHHSYFIVLPGRLLRSLSENMKNTFCHCERSEAISLINNQLERCRKAFSFSQ
ncbi:MAG: hypothetical protein H8E87_06570 [FCB group bacterium]|nr:hypothetical protein [FCB group bacterium]